MSAAPALIFDQISKVYCDDLLRSSRYALTDMLVPWRLRGNRQPELRPGEFLALDSVSLTIGAGETVGVIGGRRSGKSTLAGIAGGLLRAESGNITRGGSVALVNGLTAGMRPMLTLRENAAFRAALYGVPADQIAPLVDEAMAFAGVRDEADRVIFNVDPLLVRNVGLALALALRPDLLIFDESLALRGLPDEEAGLARLHAALQGRASILVSGNRKLLEQLATRCLVLDHGRLIFDGPVLEAFLQLERLRGSDATAISTPAAFADDDDGDDDGDDADDEIEDTDSQNPTERDAARQEKLTVRLAKQEARAQANTMRLEKLQRQASTIQPQKIILNGVDLLPNQSRLIAKAGETVTFDVELLLGPLLAATGVELQLYASHSETPLAQVPLKITIEGPGTERRLTFKGHLTLPQLQQYQYRLVAHLETGRGISRDTTVKLGVIGIYGGQPGQGTGPDLQVRLD